MSHIKFQGFSGYLNNMSYYADYGGMNWNDMYEIQNSYVNQHPWCDTGYNNVLSGQGEGITLGNGGFESYNSNRTFSLEKGTFASAWETNQPVYFNSYTYTAGQGFSLKASDEVLLSQNATTIDFAKYGSDFRHISEIMMISGKGQGGNTCSYGTPTYGYILVMDNLDIKWNNSRAGAGVLHPSGSGHPLHAARPLPHIAANMMPEGNHGEHSPLSAGTDHAGAAFGTSYHSQLLSLAGHDFGSPTSQFVLPQADHFGS
jgi:hypothetical protein